jgi:hypothetical protein
MKIFLTFAVWLLFVAFLSYKKLYKPKSQNCGYFLMYLAIQLLVTAAFTWWINDKWNLKLFEDRLLPKRVL